MSNIQVLDLPMHLLDVDLRKPHIQQLSHPQCLQDVLVAGASTRLDGKN